MGPDFCDLLGEGTHGANLDLVYQEFRGCQVVWTIRMLAIYYAFASVRLRWSRAAAEPGSEGYKGRRGRRKGEPFHTAGCVGVGGGWGAAWSEPLRPTSPSTSILLLPRRGRPGTSPEALLSGPFYFQRA